MNDNVRVEPYCYNEKDCLGSGTFGEVYKGFHEQKRSQVFAIKRMKKGKLPQDLIDREIQILQELSEPDVQHNHFVTLVDCVQTEKHIYLVMEYCNGGDLEHYLKEIRKMDEESIKIFLQQIASALKILKDHEIVHRDLKPANILLSHSNGITNVADITFKIADFGLGRFLDQGVQAQTFCGTPVYMAPEVFIPNAQYDYKADLWSIGAIVYQLLTGTLYSPFAKQQKLVFPLNTSQELQHLLTGLLNKEPKDRMNFDEFFRHPFIGIKSEVKKPTKKNLPAAAAGVGAVAAGVGLAGDTTSNDGSTQSNRFGWFRRTFRRSSRGSPKDDQQKILGNNATGQSSSPSQPLTPKGKEQSPVQKYTGEPSAGKAANAMTPNNNSHAKVQQVASTKRGGFFNFWRPTSPPIREVSLSTQLMKTLTSENRDVFGVSHLDGRFYVLSRSPNSIVFYSDQSPFIDVKDFRLHPETQIKLPQDVAASSVSNCLYVSDIGNSCIWKVQPGYPTKVMKWIPDVHQPHTLSVSREGRVVTFGNRSRNLTVYGPDGSKIQDLPLPGEVKEPLHAVETSKGNFIISYGGQNAKKQGVCEICPRGKIQFRYEHKTEKVNNPCHLAIDPDDRVFVADYGNNRVLQLDSRLKLEQVLPTESRGKLEKPFRVCLAIVKGQRRLLIQHRNNSVDIYNVSVS